MISQVSRHSANKYNTVEARRSVQSLPDGNIAVLTFDLNRSDSSFGDKNNIAKGYIRVLSASNGAILGTASFPVYGQAGLPLTSIQGGMSVDSSGNLHAVYTYHATPQNPHPPAQGQQVRYIKATRSGNTFTLGTAQIVYTATTYEAIASIDIDIPGTSGDYPVIVNAFTNWDSNKSHVRIHHRQVNGTWWSDYIHEMDGLYHFPSVSIGCRTDTGTSAFSFAVTYTTVPIAADQGDFIITGRFNLGGIRIGVNPYWKSGLNKHQNDGWREFTVFHAYEDIFLVAGTTDMNPWRPFFGAFKINQSSGEITTVFDPYAHADVGGEYSKHANIPFSAWSLMKETPTLAKLIAYHFDDEHVYANFFQCYMADGTLSISPIRHRVKLTQAVNEFGATTPLSLGAGDHGRHATPSNISVLITYGEPTFHQLLANNGVPGRGVNIYPPDGAYVPEGTPRVASRPNGFSQTNVIGRVEFEAALDANFTSGVVSAITSNYIWANGSNIANAYLLGERLIQNKYYLRSRVRDILGRYGNWSNITHFWVSHKPSAKNLSPTGGSHVGYNLEGKVTFVWRFIDPDPMDSQTAYQIVVTNTMTNTVIANTGKVASNAGQALLDIAEAHAEQMLEWQLTLWDGDDVSSSNIQPARFYLAKAPIVTINSPAAGVPVNTATPTVSWSSVLFNNRTQQGYRVIVYRLSDHRKLFDTGFRFGSATSVVLPPNMLRNKIKFSAHVMVQDTNSLVGRDVRDFETLWDLPMELDPPVVDITEHSTKGYAYVTAPAPDVSSYVYKDFIVAYNILRRTYESGGQEWVTVYSGMPSGQEFIAIKDWLLPAGIPTEYVFTMTLDQYGEVQAGDPDKSRSTLVEPTSGNYWLIDLRDPYRSILLPHVTDDSWTDEYEQQDFNIINRGRVVELGDRIGNSGSLTCQLRDRMNGFTGVPVTNSASNARLLTDSSGASIPSWKSAASSGTTIQIAETHSFAPSPTDRIGLLAVRLQQVAGDPKGTLSQDMFRIKPGTVHHGSVWFECSRSAPGTYFDLKLEYWNSQLDNGSVLASFTERVTFQSVSNTSVPIGDTVTMEYQAKDNHYSWYRIDVSGACPAGSLKAKLTISMDSSAFGNTINYNFGGVALTDHPSRFFDGYSPDAEWLGNPATDPSYTPGKYTARRQRQNVEAMKAERGEVVLRTPFGDAYRVQVGSIGVSRIPGVGSNEFVDLSIPYLELSDD